MKKSCRSVYISFFGVYLYLFNIFLSLPRERECKMCTWYSHFLVFFCFLRILTSLHAVNVPTHIRSRSRTSTFISLRFLSFFPCKRFSFTCLREYISVARYIIIPTQPFVHAYLFKISSLYNRTCDVIPYFIIS